MKEYILIAVFTYPHETLIVRNLLDTEGIRYMFLNETMVGIFPFYSNALGGIKLKVHPEDFKRAKSILEKLDPTDSHLKIV